MALPMMTATAVASQLAKATGIPSTDVRHILDELKILAMSEVENCKRFKLVGLVQLEPKVKAARKARIGRNPRTGEEVQVAAKPAEAVVRPRLLTEARTIPLSLKKLQGALEASQPARPHKVRPVAIPAKQTKVKKKIKAKAKNKH